MQQHEVISLERGRAGLDSLVGKVARDWHKPEEEHTTEWAAPITFDTLTTPDIPASLLPDPIGRYVGELSAHTETPPALCVMASLGAVSTATRGRVHVELDDGHREPTNIYAAAAMASGNRKSAVFSQLSEPLTTWEREQAEALKVEIARKRSKRKSEEAVIEQRRRKLHSIEDTTLRNQEITDIAKAETELTIVPKLPKLFANDTTPEALSSSLDDQDGVFGILSDEGGVFDVLAGLYTNGMSNIDVVLKGWDRGACRIRRKDREIDMNPCLTMALCVQPSTLGNFASKRAFQGRGLAERLLFFIPQSTLGYREHDKPAPSASAVIDYSNAIHRILNDGRVRTLKLSRQANDDLREFRRAIEKKLRPGGKLAEFAGWGSKLPGQLARIAGLMHLVEQPAADVISQNTMTRALDLGALLIDHALAAFVEMGMDQSTSDARRCWRWIEGQASFTRGELTLAMRHVINAERITAGLKVLAGRNLIDSDTGTPTPRTRERTFRVNPNIGGNNGLA